MEVLSKFAEYFALQIAGPNPPGSLVKLLEILILISLLVIAAFARPLALRIGFLRGIFRRNEERYVGRYVQIINSDDERRYSVLDIRYQSYTKGYHLIRVQYDPNRNRTIDFESENVAFRNGPTSFL